MAKTLTALQPRDIARLRRASEALAALLADLDADAAPAPAPKRRYRRRKPRATVPAPRKRRARTYPVTMIPDAPITESAS